MAGLAGIYKTKMKINKVLLLSSLLISLISLSLSVCNAGTSVANETVAMSGTVSLTGIGLLLDDFESGTSANNWGGQYGQLNIGSGRSVNITRETGGNPGNCLRVDYNVPNSADWAGMSIGLANQPVESTSRDIYSAGAGAKTFSFDIKGASAGQSFKIEWKRNGVTNTAILYLSDYLGRDSGTNSGTSTGWETVTIPIDAFANFQNIIDLSIINLIFEHDYLLGNEMLTSHTIWLDNIKFGGDEPALVIIDTFGDAWGLNALGGNIGTMPNVGTTISFNFLDFSPSPRSLALSYDMAEGWSGVWFEFGGGDRTPPGSKATSHDFSAYNYLKIRVKLASDVNHPTKIKLELQDAGGSRVAYIPDNTDEPTVPLSTTWHEYTVPLTAAGGLLKASIKQFNIVLESGYRDGSGTGIVWFDSIRFEK